MRTEIEIEINCKVTRIPDSIEINFVPIPENNSLIGKVYMVNDNSYIDNLSIQLETTRRLYGNKLVIVSEPYTKQVISGIGYKNYTFIDVISPITLYKYSVLFNKMMVLDNEHIELPKTPCTLSMKKYIPTDNHNIVNLTKEERFPNVCGLELLIVSPIPYNKLVTTDLRFEPIRGLFVDCFNLANGCMYSVPFEEEFIAEY